MKKILTLLFIAIACTTQAQVLQTPANYGVGFRRTGADTLLYIPSDTLTVPAWGAAKSMLARKGSALYYWNGSAWTAVSGGSTNIYNSDGTLTSARIIDADNKDFAIHNINQLEMYSGTNPQIVGMRFDPQNAVEITAYKLAKESAISVFSDSIIIYPNEGKIKIDSLAAGSVSDNMMTWNATTGMVGKVSMYQERILHVSLAADDDTITAPGIVMIDNGSNGPGFKELLFPDPANFSGSTITLINYDTVLDALYNATNAPVNPSGTAFTKAVKGYSYIFKSDGVKWYCVSRYTGTTD